MFSPIRVPETPYIVRSLSVDVERRIFIGRHQTEPAWMLDFLPDGGIGGWDKRLGHCEAGWNKDGRRHCEGNIHC